MSQVISLPEYKLSHILKTLANLKKEIVRLKQRVDNLEPVYGSKQWWEWSDKKALEDIKGGRVKKIHNQKELQQLLDSLKAS